MGMTPLYYAARYNRGDMVRSLVPAPVSSYALAFAVRYSRTGGCYQVRKKANVNTTDKVCLWLSSIICHCRVVVPDAVRLASGFVHTLHSNPQPFFSATACATVTLAPCLSLLSGGWSRFLTAAVS